MGRARTTEVPPFGVIFDMDGVLVDSADAHWRSWELLSVEVGRPVSKQDFLTTFGRQNRDIIPLLFGPVSPERLVQLGDRKEAIYRDLIRKRPPIVEGAVELIHDLHRAGAALAVGSSGPRANIELVIAAMGLSDRVMVIVSSNDVSRGKPDPQVFQVACDWLGLPPRNCVVIEDAPSGVAAAKAAGAYCVAVMMHHSREALSAADIVVDRLADITVTMLRELARPP